MSVWAIIGDNASEFAFNTRAKAERAASRANAEMGKNVYRVVHLPLVEGDLAVMWHVTHHLINGDHHYQQLLTEDKQRIEHGTHTVTAIAKDKDTAGEMLHRALTAAERDMVRIIFHSDGSVYSMEVRDVVEYAIRVGDAVWMTATTAQRAEEMYEMFLSGDLQGF